MNEWLKNKALKVIENVTGEAEKLHWPCGDLRNVREAIAAATDAMAGTISCIKLHGKLVPRY